MKKSTPESFWEKVRKGINENDCWLWTKSKSDDGYGKCVFIGEQLSHRISYKLTFGEIPDGKCVLHKCDNRLCVNPRHLFLGTRIDNNKDRDLKNRTARGDRHGSRTMPEARPKGEKHSRSKLTNEQVRQIRNMYKSGRYSHRQLSEIFSVFHTTIGSVIRRETRKDT